MGPGLQEMDPVNVLVKEMNPVNVSKEMDPVNVLLIFIIVSIVLFILLFFFAYKVFFRNRHDYHLIGDDAFGFGDVPRDFINDEETLNHLAEEYDFTHLSPEEQTAYLNAEEYTKANPPHFQNTRGKSYTAEQDSLVKDCGINAFEFEQERDILSARYIVADKTEIHFLNNDSPYSTATSVLNYSLPVKNRTYSDTVYFEMKVFEYDNSNENGHFAIGLVTKPYPSSFRLPGYNNFSIAYESTGNLKINKPFPTPLQQHMGDNSKFNAQVLPPLHQSDIVGFGYVVSTGTIFITRNGKKVMDVIKDCYVDLYPAVGCFSTNAKFQANLGQLGFVWIEANVRKYGFISTSDYKKIKGDRGLAALPQYGDSSKGEGDKLLDKGEELPPDYPEDELDFFGRSTKDLVKVGSSSKTNRKSKDRSSEKNDEKSVRSSNSNKGSEEPKGEPNRAHSSSEVTDDSEEVMDMRQRLYEQNATDKKADSELETTPLIKPNASTEDDNNTYSTFLNADPSVQKKERTTVGQQESSSESASPAPQSQTTSTARATASVGSSNDATASSESPELPSSAANKNATSSPRNKNKKKKKSGKKSGKKKGSKKK